MKFSHTLFVLLLLTATFRLAAQPTEGGRPLGRDVALSSTPLSDKATFTVAAPDVERLRQEDLSRSGFRFAAPIAVSISPENAGEWTTLPNGDRLWRIRLHAPGAKAIAALYDNFYLPPGARLFMYSPDGSQILGAYTDRNNSKTGRFMTGFISGESAIVEYFEPVYRYGQGRFHIFRLDYAYHSDPNQNEKSVTEINDFGFEASWDCHPNAICPPADTMQQQRRSVCRIIVVVEEGSGYCTGTLVNNTRNNGMPYVISGFHCMDGYTPLWDLWRFDFKYQSASCSNPASEPGFQSMLGCDNRAGRRENDFLLLELFQNIPAGYQAYFAGWDHRPNVPARSIFMHHPLGDIKKISVDTQVAVVQNTPIQWNNTVTTPTQHHFRVRPDIGSFQVGSSGAGLFNENRRFVGQLHGGFSTCDSTVAYFGRMTLAWNGGGSPITRLRDWLDPDNTDSLSIAGIENPAAGSVITLTGTIRTESGTPVPGVKVWIEGMLSDTATTGASGEFSFPLLDPGMEYTLGFLKDNNHSNGVSTQDVIRIQRQILSIENLSSAYKQFAGDVNQSGSVSTLDVILIRRIILTIMDRFPDISSWQFFPANYTFADPVHPFGELTPNRVQLGMLTQSVSVNITGVKSGDVNESAGASN